MKSMLRAVMLATTTLVALPAFAEDAPAPAKTEAAKPADSSADATVIKLDSETIKNSDVQDVWKGLFPPGQVPDFNSFDENIRQNVLRGIVSEHLIYGQATAAGYDKNEEVKKRIAALEKQVIMQTYLEDKAKTMVTDAEIKKAYDEKVAGMKGDEEIKARHILVPTEDEAKAIADQLKKGGDFEKIAKEKSADKGSGAEGGELGWFTKDKMVPEFADAAFKLKKNEISAPVKTSFGWHIIQVEDRRPVKPPTFDEMKESLKTELTNKAMQKYVEGLLKKADIKYYGPDGKEKPFSREIAPPKKAEEK